MNASDGFAPLLGRWRTHGVVVDRGEHDGAVVEGTDTYARLGERFVVHHADVSFAGVPQHSVEVFVLDGDRFEATAYTDTGDIETVTGGFDADGTYRADNATTRVTLRADADTMTANWELRTDDEWRPWLDMTFEGLA